MKTIEMKAYEFEDLSDSAKEKARQWYRECSIGDEWWDFVFEDFESICKILGIEIGETVRHCVLIGKNGREWDKKEKKIYFSGFSSQGDGASFAGRYAYAKGCGKKIRDYAPQDKKLHKIADALTEIQKPYRYGLKAEITQDGRYVHKYTMDVEVSHADDENHNRKPVEIKEEDRKALLEAFRDLAEWLYRTLEAEDEYRNADEQVDDNIKANEYLFTEDGERSAVL